RLHSFQPVPLVVDQLHTARRIRKFFSDLVQHALPFITENEQPLFLVAGIKERSTKPEGWVQRILNPALFHIQVEWRNINPSSFQPDTFGKVISTGFVLQFGRGSD